jgi:Tol biopolymer transport system component
MRRVVPQTTVLCSLVLTVPAPVPAQTAPATLGKVEMSYPYPSPDGSTLVFQSNLDGRWQLYAMALPDGATRRLHSSDRDDTHPSISPDGKSLAFISNRDGNDDVYLLDLASGRARPVSPHPGKDGHPKWSRDGQWLTFNRTFDPADKGGGGDSAIMQVRPDGSDLRVVTDSPRVETFPSFSADGRRIVFIEWFPNAAGERNRNGDLVIVDIESKTRAKLTTSDGFDGQPYWGPSGEWIYFSSPVRGSSGSNEVVTLRIRPDGTGQTILTPLDGAPEVRGIPSSDERTLYFNKPGGGRVTIHSVPIAGS